MAKPQFLLDLDVIAELTRPAGTRRVFTLFQQRQASCTLPAPVMFALLRGVETLSESPRKSALREFCSGLLQSGLPVLGFEREAAVWLAREAVRREKLGRAWSLLEGELAAIAVTGDLVLVTRDTPRYAGTPGLRLEDWFRP